MNHSERQDAPPPAGLGTSALAAVVVAFGYLLYCICLQHATGAVNWTFNSYPDEPAHFVGSLMIHDWLLSGQWNKPLAFAQDYYAHYPYFAIGYWPPLFHILTGTWLLIAGVSRQQALILPAAAAAGSAWMIFLFLRRSTGFVWAICAGAAYLALPVSQQWVGAVMVDHVTAALEIGATYLVVRYLRVPSMGRAVACGVACGAAILSKYSAGYTAVIPFAAVIFLRRWTWFKKPSLWVQPAIVAALAGPWVWFTRSMTFYGLPNAAGQSLPYRLGWFVRELASVFPVGYWVFLVAALVAFAVARLRGRAADAGREVDPIWLAVVVGILGHYSLLVLSPVGAEGRYLLAVGALMLALAFAALYRAVSAFVPWMVSTSGVVVLTLGAVLGYYGSFRAPQSFPIRELAHGVEANPDWKGKSIMVPPDMEGMTIAEFALAAQHRPDRELIRPVKVFAKADWNSVDYSTQFTTPELMRKWFRDHPVGLLLWREPPPPDTREHDRVLRETVLSSSDLFHPVKVFGSVAAGAQVTVYEQR